MSDWFRTIQIILLVIVTFSVAYHFLPAKNVAAIKPRFAFFPKYKFQFGEIAEIENKPTNQGFRKISSRHFVRGHILGDFFAKWIRLSVKLNHDTKTAVIGSPFIAIAFDTGDLWTIAKSLKG